MRILFAGTPQPAVHSLNALVEAGHNVVGVLTRTDAKVGRKRVLTPSPVAARAAELNLPTIKIDSFSAETGSEALEQIQQLEADIGAVVAYGGLLPQNVLDLFDRGWVNLHFSLLPAYRGAAPVQWAIMSQEEQTGAAVFQLEADLDTGPVYSTLKYQLTSDQTAGDVLEALSASGATLLSDTLFDIAQDTAVGHPQQGEVSWAPKITSHQVQIDPAQTANQVRALINGASPAPGAWGKILVGDQAPVRFKVGRAKPVPDDVKYPGVPGEFILEPSRVLLICKNGAVELLEVQPSGKKMMSATDWARGVDQDIRLQTSITHPNEFTAE